MTARTSTSGGGGERGVPAGVLKDSSNCSPITCLGGPCSVFPLCLRNIFRWFLAACSPQRITWVPYRVSTGFHNEFSWMLATSFWCFQTTFRGDHKSLWVTPNKVARKSLRRMGESHQVWNPDLWESQIWSIFPGGMWDQVSGNITTRRKEIGDLFFSRQFPAKQTEALFWHSTWRGGLSATLKRFLIRARGR